MSDVKKFSPGPDFSAKAHINSLEQYKKLYNESVEDIAEFWGKIADRLHWSKKWEKVVQYDFVKANIKWFEGGKLNVSYNCLDRHVEAGHGNKTALIWEGNNPNESKTFTYSVLLANVQKFANVLKANGVKKGDRVCIYLQMIPELPIAMLACARVGAVHSIVFGAFSAESLRDRINDSSCKMLITQDTGVRGTKTNIPMKTNADIATAECPSIEKIVVVRRTGESVNMEKGRDIYWDEAFADAKDQCPPETMDAEDPLFILYTSGSTGKPKKIAISNLNMLAEIQCMSDAYGFDKSIRHLCLLPIYHASGLYRNILLPFHVGGEVVIVSKFVVEGFWNIIALNAFVVADIFLARCCNCG